MDVFTKYQCSSRAAFFSFALALGTSLNAMPQFLSNCFGQQPSIIVPGVKVFLNVDKNNEAELRVVSVGRVILSPYQDLVGDFGVIQELEPSDEQMEMLLEIEKDVGRHIEEILKIEASQEVNRANQMVEEVTSEIDSRIRDCLLPEQLSRLELIRIRLLLRQTGILGFLRQHGNLLDLEISNAHLSAVEDYLLAFKSDYQEKSQAVAKSTLGRLRSCLTPQQLNQLLNDFEIQLNQEPLEKLFAQLQEVARETGVDAMNQSGFYQSLRRKGSYVLHIDGRWKLESLLMEFDVSDEYLALAMLRTIAATEPGQIAILDEPDFELIRNWVSEYRDEFVNLRNERNDHMTSGKSLEELKPWFDQEQQKLRFAIKNKFEAEIAKHKRDAIRSYLKKRVVKSNGIWVELASGQLETIALSSRQQKRLREVAASESKVIGEFFEVSERKLMQEVLELLDKSERESLSQILDHLPKYLAPSIPLLTRVDKDIGPFAR